MDFLPPVPSVRLPTANSSSHSGPVFQSPHSSSQPPCTPVNTRPSPGHVGLWYGPSVYFSLCPICHRLAASPSSNSLKCFPSVPIDFPIREGVSPNSGISTPLPWGAGPALLPLLLLLPSFLCPTQLCRDLYSPFRCPRSSAGLL